MIVKTNCTGCSENLMPGCGFHIETYMEPVKLKFRQVTNNYCRFKRYTVVSKEDIRISDKSLCLITMPDEKLYDRIKYIDEIYIIGHNLTREQRLDIQQKVSGRKWTIDNYVDNFSTSIAINKAVADMKSDWAITCLSGTLDDKLLKYHIELADTDEKYCCVKSTSELIINKYAFLDMGGNSPEQSWLEKLKQFDNWEEVCGTLPQA